MTGEIMKFNTEQLDTILGTYATSVDAKDDYDARRDVVKALAVDFKVSEPVIRGVLVSAKVYIPKADAKASTSGIKTTKEDVAKAIEIYVNVKMPSLRNMTKKDLDGFWAGLVLLTAVNDAENGVK